MLRRTRFNTPDGDIAALEFGDPAADLSCLFIHATGFNAMTYQSILAPLGLRARVAAIDVRGHGNTTLPARRRFASWHKFRDDVIDWLEHYAPGGVVLGGHSMGGCVALLVAGKRPDLVRGLVLADPVILNPRTYRNLHLAPFMQLAMTRSRMARNARRRRPSFPSVDAAKDSYTSKAVFKSWREPFLDDYLLDGLARIDDGPPQGGHQVWSLTCDPRFEAAVFAAQRNRPWGALKKVKKYGIPITILLAERDSVMSNACSHRIIERYPTAIVKTIRGTSHFLPMEAPYALREELSGYLSRLFEGFTAETEGPVRRSLEPKEGTRIASGPTGS
ncbi:MAG: alpha/beta hydrolase [Pseudomonadota bacterium]